MIFSKSSQDSQHLTLYLKKRNTPSGAPPSQVPSQTMQKLLVPPDSFGASSSYNSTFAVPSSPKRSRNYHSTIHFVSSFSVTFPHTSIHHTLFHFSLCMLQCSANTEEPLGFFEGRLRGSILCDWLRRGLALLLNFLEVGACVCVYMSGTG